MPKPVWEPPPEGLLGGRLIADADRVYDVLMSALHELSRSETVRSEIAVIALAAVMGSLACATGVLWSSPNVIATLRALVDDLERRRSTQAEPPLLRTLREFFEAARPTMAQ